MAAWEDQQILMRRAGFTGGEIAAEKQKQYQTGLQAGFPQEEMDHEFGPSNSNPASFFSWDTVKAVGEDVGEFATDPLEMVKSVTQGVVEGAAQTQDFLAEYFPATVLGMGPAIFEQITGKKMSEAIDPLTDVLQPETGTGKVVSAIAQFVAPFSQVSKARLGMAGLSKIAQLGEAALKGVVVDIAAFDPRGERLSNLIESVPQLQNDVTAFLQAKPGDTDAEGRLKNAIEGAGLGTVADGLFMAFKFAAGVKNTKATLTTPVASDETMDASLALAGQKNGINGVDPDTAKAVRDRVVEHSERTLDSPVDAVRRASNDGDLREQLVTGVSERSPELDRLPILGLTLDAEHKAQVDEIMAKVSKKVLDRVPDDVQVEVAKALGEAPVREVGVDLPAAGDRTPGVERAAAPTTKATEEGLAKRFLKDESGELKDEPKLEPTDEGTVLSRVVSDADNKRTFREAASNELALLEDDLHPVLKLLKAVAGKDAKLLAEAADVEQFYRATESAGEFAQQRIKFGRTDKQGNKLAPALDAVWGELSNKRSKVNGVGADGRALTEKSAFEAYAVARRVVELHGQGKRTGVDIEAAKRVVKKGNQKFSARFKLNRAFSADGLEVLRDAGLVSEARYDNALEMAQDYVPTHRFLGEPTKAQRAAAGKGKQAWNPVKELKGSEKPIISIRQTMIQNTLLESKVATRNIANASLETMADKLPGAIVGKRRLSRPNVAADKELQAMADELGAEAMDMDFVYDRHFIKSLGKDEIPVYKDGEAWAVRFSDEWADVPRYVKGMDPIELGLLGGIMERVAHGVKIGSTVVNVAFPVQQVVMDELFRFVTSPNPSPTIFGDWARGIVPAITKDKNYQAALASGAFNSTFHTVGRDYKNLHHLYDDPTFFSGLRNPVATSMQALYWWSDVLANAGRLGEDMRARKGGATPEAAALRARKTRLDFARQGRNIRTLNRFIPFLGPAINGLSTAARGALKNPVAFMAKGTAVITIPTLINWWVNKDEDWYKRLPEWQKDLAMPVWSDGQSAVAKVRLPMNIASIFSMIPRRLAEAHYRQNPRAWDGFERTVMGDLTPPAGFAIATPVIELLTNHNFMTGGPLVPERLEEVLAPEQYTEYTSESAKALAKTLSDVPLLREMDLSPIEMETVANGWLGGGADVALKLLDKGLGAAGAIPKSPRRDTIVDWPFMRSFFLRYPKADQNALTKFYENLDNHEKLMGSMRVVREELAAGNPDAIDRLKELLTENQADFVKLDAYRAGISKSRTLIRAIEISRIYSDEDKKKLTDLAGASITLQAQIANTVMARIAKAVEKKQNAAKENPR